MSWDAMPEWTKDKHVITSRGEVTEDAQHNTEHGVRCPLCRTDHTGKALERIEEAMEVGTYWAAHVPPYVELTCRECEEDFKVFLSLTVKVTGVGPSEQR